MSADVFAGHGCSDRIVAKLPMRSVFAVCCCCRRIYAAVALVAAAAAYAGLCVAI